MSRKYLIPDEGTFYKANLHCHTTVSDGRRTPEQIKESYKAHGYQIVAFTDHNKLIPHTELKDDCFIPITSVEINLADVPHVSGSAFRTYHLNFFSKTEDMRDFPEYEMSYASHVINKLIADAANMGFLCQYNHPRWSFQDANDFTPLRNLWGFEVYNHGCEITLADGWGDEEYRQYILTDLFPVATANDDNHNVYPDGSPDSDSYGGFTMIKAKSLTYTDVMDALEKKDCYASTGPVIKGIYVEDGLVHIETDGVCSVFMRTDTRRTARKTSLSDDIRDASFELDEKYNYIWFIVFDTHGKKAFTRAYTKKEWQKAL